MARILVVDECDLFVMFVVFDFVDGCVVMCMFVFGGCFIVGKMNGDIFVCDFR